MKSVWLIKETPVCCVPKWETGLCIFRISFTGRLRWEGVSGGLCSKLLLTAGLVPGLDPAPISTCGRAEPSSGKRFSLCLVRISLVNFGTLSPFHPFCICQKSLTLSCPYPSHKKHLQRVITSPLTFLFSRMEESAPSASPCMPWA